MVGRSKPPPASWIARAMHPLLLTFYDPAVEAAYTRHRVTSVLKANKSVFLAWTVVRTIIMYFAVIKNKPNLTWVQRVAFGSFWTLPIFEGLLRQYVSEEWFSRHGTRLHLIEGVSQSSIAASMVNFITSSPRDKSAILISDIVLASGSMIQTFNLWWYPMNFKFHMFLSSYTAILWIVTVLPIFIVRIESAGFTSASQTAASTLDVMFDGLTFCLGGSCSERPDVSFYKLFVFWQIYVYMVVIPFCMWFLERLSRVEFWTRWQGANSDLPVIERNRMILEYIAPITLAMPIAWHLSSWVSHCLWVPNLQG